MSLIHPPQSGLATHETNDRPTVLDFVMRSGTSTSTAGDDPSKPPVLEVAAMWADTVVDVRHVRQGGKSVTGGSATGLRWRFLGMPVAWVPPRFAQLAWLMAPMISETTEEWTSDFFIPAASLPADQFELFTWDGAQFECRFSADWDGFADVGEERLDFAELIATGRAQPTGPGIYSFPVAEGTRVVADLGEVTLFGQLVPDSARVRAAPGAGLDPVFLGTTGFFSAIFAMLLMVLWTSPPPPDSSVVALDDRVASLVLHRPPPPVPAPVDDAQGPKDSAGAKAKKKEGRRGDKKSKQAVAKGDPVPKNKKVLDREVAAAAGLMGAFADDAAIAAALGQSALSADLMGGVGGVMGAKGVQFGSGGIGSRGGSLGGGGSADGIGGLSTHGRASGRDSYGVGGGEFKKKKTGALGRVNGEPIVLGALDKSLIDQVVKRHMNQIRYCYQRELTRTPGLSGKVTVKFVIDREGGVSSAKVKSSTLSSAKVESCITSRFLRFTFPKPNGNGIVIVSYPFLFSPG